jgi:PAS domain S-box-containing protein
MAHRRAFPVSDAELFRLLIHRVSDYAIYLLDEEGYIASWNEGAERIKGYTADEVIGKHVGIFYTPQDVRRGKPTYELRVAADEGRLEDEGWRVRKDGSRFWAAVSITALRTPAGELLGFSKVTRDASAQRRAEEEREKLLELERSARERAELVNERLAAMQRLTEAALAHLSLDELLHELLDRIVELLVVDTAAVLLREHDVLVVRAAHGLDERAGMQVRLPIGVGLAGRVASERRAIVLEDVPHTELPNRLLKEQGLTSMVGVPLLIEGRVLGVVHVGARAYRRFNDDDVQLLQLVADRVALAIDHTRLLEAERQARLEATEAGAAVRLRDEFLSIAAHELKTPITSLLGSAQLLTRRLDQGEVSVDARTRHRVQTIESQARRLGQLVSQLLDVSRVQAGRLLLDRQPTDVAALARSVASQLSEHGDTREIVVDAPQSVVASVDPLRIEQVLTNLLSNALKYGPTNRPIQVDVQSSPETLQISVRDYGPGIPRERRGGLFDRFYQARAGDHRSGMGLGLYISRQIVEQHGGRIQAEFPRDGGTRLLVELPVE